MYLCYRFLRVSNKPADVMLKIFEHNLSSKK